MNERLLVFFEVRRFGKRTENWLGHVLFAEGKQVTFELEQIGRDWDEWGYINQPPLTQNCVMLWEGVCRNENITHPEWEPDFVGEWRVPTATELAAMLTPPQAKPVDGNSTDQK